MMFIVLKKKKRNTFNIPTTYTVLVLEILRNRMFKTNYELH